MGRIVKKSDLAGKMNLEAQVLADEKATVASVSLGRKVVRRENLEASTEAKGILDEAHQEASAIKQSARDILQRVEAERQKAREQGYADGREDGLSQVTELLAKISREKEAFYGNLEKEVIRLVYDISEKIIGRELAERETAIIDLIKQALHASMGQQIIVLVHPQDLESVRKNQALLVQALDASKTIQVRGDEKVTPKSCIIETEIGTIDARLETQLKAIRRALELEEEEGPAGE